MRQASSLFALILGAALLAFPLTASAQETARASNVQLPSTANQVVAVQLFGQQSVVGMAVSGLTASGATLTIEGSADAKNQADPSKIWFLLNAVSSSCSGAAFSTVTTDQQFRIDIAGLSDFRIRVSTPGSGSNISVGYNAIPAGQISAACAGSGGGGGGSVTQGTSPWVVSWSAQTVATTAADGSNVALGTTTDLSSANTLIGLMKANNAKLDTLNTTAGGAIPAGANVIGKVSIDQTTPGTTNLVATSAASGDPCNGSTAHASAAFAITSATQTSLVAAVSAKKIYICSLTMITGAANNANFYDVAAAGACSSAATDAVIGASSNAATNGLNFAANGGLTQGNGVGMLASTPTANSTLCVVTSSAGPFSGVLTYVQQ